MNNSPIPDPTPEELAEMLEKAKRDLQEALDKMTPQEREQAEIKAKKLIEEDAASMRRLIDDAAKVAAGEYPKEPPKFCEYCGSPVSGGKYCTNCGHLL